MTTIHSSHTQYIDPLDRLHVVRPNSPLFSQYGDSTKCDAIEVLRFCMRVGEVDETRRDPKMHRVMNIGVKAETQALSEPIKVYGNKYFDGLSENDGNKMKTNIGNIVDLIWNTCQLIQSFGQLPKMGGNFERKRRYGTEVRNILFAKYSEFESVTIAVTILYPVAGQCFLHKDVLNDTTPGYTRTGCLDMIIGDSDGTVYLLQILGNFRKSAGNSLSKGATKTVEQISKNIDDYFLFLQQHYRKMMQEYSCMATSFSFATHPTNVEDFFLDDNLLFENEYRKNKATQHCIELLVLPIGPY